MEDVYKRQGIRSCRLCRNLLLCVLSIDFALPLTIMLLEPEKWMVPKCSTIQNSARKSNGMKSSTTFADFRLPANVSHPGMYPTVRCAR